jgi:multidrug efflux pump
MSSLSEISIQRPVLTIVLSILIVIFGVIGFSFLGVREYPSIDPPVITVSTNYQGANADIIESQITEPMEEALNGIAGIRSMTSVSRDGRSTITVEFELEVDIEAAANDVRDKVSANLGRLPQDADPPTVAKANADGSPIILLNIQSDRRTLLELTDIAATTFKERFQTIQGVSEVQIWGEQRYAMRLWLDPARMSAYSITALDVRNVLLRENIELPSGKVEGNFTELTIRTLGRLTSPEDFNNMIIKQEGDKVVKFVDIGKAIISAENERSILRRNGIPMVMNAIIPQPGANQVQIAEEFYKRWEQIKKEIPSDLQTAVSMDVTRYIKASISEVQETIVISFLLVVCIIFLFLRDWRTTIIPVLAIPISLVGTFFFLYWLGYSINVLTLLGIVLAIGLVVDDAIVVLENIYAKIEAGMSPIQAAFKGSKEIFFAVISTTITLVAVFLPIVFLQGLTGRLFREFGVTVAASVLISAFVALTLTPMMSGKILKHQEKPNFFYRLTEPFFLGMNQLYQKSLDLFLKIRWVSILIMIGAIFGIYWFIQEIPQELAPLEDRSTARISASAPEGASFEFMDNFVKDFIKVVDEKVPEKDVLITFTSPSFGASSSVNSAGGRIIFTQPSERTRKQQEIVDDLNGILRKELSDARVNIIQEATIGARTGGAQLPVQLVIQATSLEKLQEILPQFEAEARKSPKFSFVDVNLKFTKPEILLSINREKAASLGVSVADVAQTLQLAMSGQRFGYFLMSGRQYQVIGQVDRENRNEPLDVRSLYVRNRQGQLVQLDNLVFTEEKSSPPQLYRYNRYISATISASLAKNVALGEGIEEMYQVADKVLDDSFSTALAGQSKDFVESSSSLLYAFLLALILVYLILAAQFESFRDPFVVMFTVPLSLAGALGSLWFNEQTINIFSQIGIIMLIGLVTKNGILIVEFANQRKEEGLSVLEAVKDSASVRFRPILMTSMSTILGILPIALALGAGSESRVSMGIAVVGGMIFGTLLTLYIIPALYSFISEKSIKKVAEEEEMPQEKAFV